MIAIKGYQGFSCKESNSDFKFMARVISDFNFNSKTDFATRGSIILVLCIKVILLQTVLKFCVL